MNQQQNTTKEMQRLQELIERLQFGEIRIIVQNGKPVRAEQVVKSIKLDHPDQEDELKTLQL